MSWLHKIEKWLQNVYACVRECVCGCVDVCVGVSEGACKSKEILT